MNNIYKVIWSKAKNCYVVASEIARSHTKSATGSEKIGGVTKRSLLASLMALSLLCGGLGVASAVDGTVHVDESSTPSTATEVYTTAKVDTLLNGKANTSLDNLSDAGKSVIKDTMAGELAKKADKTYVDNAITAAEGKIGDNTTAIGKLQAKDAELEGQINAEKTARENKDNELEGKITTLDGKVTTAQGDINALQAKDTELEGRIHTNEGNIETNKNAIAATDKRTAGIDRIGATNETTIEKNVTVDNKGNVKAKGNVTAEGKLKGEGVDAGDGAITTTGAVNAGSLNVTDASHLKGDVTMDNNLTVKGDTTLKGTKVDGKLAVTDDADLKNTKVDGTLITTGKATFQEAVEMDKGLTVTGDTKLKATTVDGKLTADEADLKDTKVDGKLGVTGDTTLDGALTAKGEAKFEKNVTVEKDLTVNGKLNVGEIYLENNKLESTGKKHDSATSITADWISNLAKVTELGHTTESQFTHNEKGTFNHAKDGNTTDWKESTSNVTADGVENIAKDSKDNNNTFTQTSTDTKNILKDKDGNTSTTRQDSKGIYGYAKDKDGNKSYTKQEGNRIAESVIGQDGKQTKSEMTSTDITNTAKDGTITNDAKDIVNNATGDMTNNVGGNLSTTVGGNEIHEVKGTKTETVEGKVTENFKNGQATNVTGNQDIHVTGKQTNTVEGGQENIISGGQTNTITGGQINNITGDQTTTITGKKTETVTENVTEDYKKNLTTTVGGNEIHEVKGTKTETVEGKVIENFKGGQETNVTGNQDIHVTKNQTNKIDGNQENTIGGDQTTNVTGDISNTAKNITNAATDTLTDKVGENTRVINSRSITDTVGRANRMIEDGKITDNAGDFTVTTDKENGTTFTNAGSTAASSFTTVDGTNTGSAQEWTNIKGNEISTGKVEANYVKMDYADVMNDLGVKGTTTTKTLKVTENATVGGTLDVTQKATFHDDVDIKKNLSVGGNATITGDVTAHSYKVGRNTYIDENGINANNQKITNVADGSISEGSKDAVNGGQLYGVKRDLEHQVDKVGANAAAMANLRPMEFDPSSKWNIAAAIGNYGSETAAAIGAFYRPNDNVMVNLSTAFGTGENMVGGGVSVRLGKGGNKLSREETNALKAQVADLTARMDALLSVLNPNMSKDFPDVPENHWAYEAVSRLAGNDIVQGYPDGEFHGERTMTRYEMAEIIYNALSRGAEAERKLVEEFKPELQAMAASEKSTAEKAEG